MVVGLGLNFGLVLGCDWSGLEGAIAFLAIVGTSYNKFVIIRWRAAFLPKKSFGPKSKAILGGQLRYYDSQSDI